MLLLLPVVVSTHLTNVVSFKLYFLAVYFRAVCWLTSVVCENEMVMAGNSIHFCGTDDLRCIELSLIREAVRPLLKEPQDKLMVKQHNLTPNNLHRFDIRELFVSLA